MKTQPTYVSRLVFQNVGPIASLELELLHNERPSPVVLTGANGSGKSLVLAHIANSFIRAQQALYVDSDVEKGMAFKIRSPLYIKEGTEFSYFRIDYSPSGGMTEWMLRRQRVQLDEVLAEDALDRRWREIPERERTHIVDELKESNAKRLLRDQACLYLPVERFERAGWSNPLSNQLRDSFSDRMNITDHSGRPIVRCSSLKSIKQWLLDVLLDQHVYGATVERLQTRDSETGEAWGMITTIKKTSDDSHVVLDAAISVVEAILQLRGELTFGVGKRSERRICINRRDSVLVPSLDQLSTGQLQLLIFALDILQDYDRSGGTMTSLEDVAGIVLVDEIDAHLHPTHQSEVLPELIALFPNVQFIVSAHSPLFLLGLERRLGSDAVQILELPTGKNISPAAYSEFGTAYGAFKSTQAHADELLEAVEAANRPLLFVEGDYDIRYITKATERLGRAPLLERFEFRDGEGSGNLSKTWKAFKNGLARTVARPTVLLFDCDELVVDDDADKVRKRRMPTRVDGPIEKGVENRFGPRTVEKLRAAKPAFVDVTPARTRTVRGVDVEESEVLEINKDEKRNVCDWLCKNGTAEDFDGFAEILDLIEREFPA